MDYKKLASSLEEVVKFSKGETDLKVTEVVPQGATTLKMTNQQSGVAMPKIMDQIDTQIKEAGFNNEFQVDIDLEPLSPSELNSALVELEAAGYTVTVKAEIRVDWRGDRTDPNR